MRVSRPLFPWALAALCLAWTAAQLSLAWTDAPIVDEPIHVFDGALAWDRGNPNANPEHPPLVKMLAAASSSPWRTRAAPLRAGEDPRAPAPAVLLDPHETAFRRIFATRLPAIAIALAAIIACGAWGRRIGGDAGGLGAAAFLASSTLYGAHAHFVTTDAAVASLAFTGAFLLIGIEGWRFRIRIAAAGLFLGAALAAKYSAVFLVPAAILFSAFDRSTRRRLAGHAGAAAVAILVLAAIVSFASRHATPAEVRAEIARARAGNTSNLLDPAGFSPLLSLGDRAAAWSPGLGRYFLGTALVASPAFRRDAYPAFFHGRITTQGALGYFPACVAFKFGTFALLAALAGVLVARRRLGWCALLTPLAYFLLSLRAHYLLGARYLLPIYPFLCVWASGLASRRGAASAEGEARVPDAGRGPRIARVALAAASVISLVAAAAAFPYWLGDSSLLGRAIGPLDGWFADSNLDWGQDLRRLEAKAAKRSAPVFIVGGSEFGGLPGLFPLLRFPDLSAPLPPGIYSATRWQPFLRAADTPEGRAAYPPALRPLITKLRNDYERLSRGPAIADLSTPSMRGSELSASGVP